MAKTKLRVEQEDEAPKREDQRERELKKALPTLVAALIVFASFAVIIVALNFDM